MMNSTPSPTRLPSSPNPSLTSSHSLNFKNPNSPNPAAHLSLNHLSQTHPKPLRRIPIHEIISLFNSQATLPSNTSSPKPSPPSLSISSGSSDTSSSSSIISFSRTTTPHSTPLRSNTPLLNEPRNKVYDIHFDDEFIKNQLMDRKEPFRASTNSMPRYRTSTTDETSNGLLLLGQAQLGGVRKRATTSPGLVPPCLPPRPTFQGSPPPLPPRISKGLSMDWQSELKSDENNGENSRTVAHAGRRDGIGSGRRKVVQRVWETYEENGRISGVVVRKIWMGCGLEIERLAKIWNLVVRGDEGIRDLGFDQFLDGFKLIDQFINNDY